MGDPKPRPCERCGAVLDHEEYGAERYHPMCNETVIAYGVVTWICYDCRKDWYREAKDQQLSREYSEASLRYEFWKDTVAAKGEGDVEEGLRLWRALDALEVKLNKFASEWLISDPGMDSENRNQSFADDDNFMDDDDG